MPAVVLEPLQGVTQSWRTFFCWSSNPASATLTFGLVLLTTGEILSGNHANSLAAPSTLEERGKAFDWFSALGFPDVKGLKLVRVATGRCYSVDNAPFRNTFVRGFLLKEHGEELKVLTLSLATETYHKTSAKTPPHEEVGHEAAELAVCCRHPASCARLSPEDQDQTNPCGRFPFSKPDRRGLSWHGPAGVTASKNCPRSCTTRRTKCPTAQETIQTRSPRKRSANWSPPTWPIPRCGEESSRSETQKFRARSC